VGVCPFLRGSLTHLSSSLPLINARFFFRNRHIQVDTATGNNNKVTWAFDEKQDLIDIIEVVYREARKGRGLAVAPREYSTKFRY
jgi:DIM1 family U5 snRNP protein